MSITFIPADYNAGNERLKSLGLYSDLFALWQDTGLKDEIILNALPINCGCKGLIKKKLSLWLQFKRPRNPKLSYQFIFLIKAGR
jgi:hypothetical protein